MLTPGSKIPQVEEITHIDKLAHVVVYAVFTFLLMKGLYERPGVKNYFLISAVIAVGYSVILEILQGFIPERSVETADIIANTVGSLLSLVIFPYFGK